MSNTSFRPEQFRCQRLLREYFTELQKKEPMPNAVITLEEELVEWQSFGDVGGIKLRGMPTLDLMVLFPATYRKIGIQLDGDSHRGFRRLIDEQQKLILDAKWGYLIRIDKQYDDSLWGWSEEDAKAQVIKHIKPILEEMKLV